MLGGGLEVLFLAESEGRRTWAVRREQMVFRYRILRSLQSSVPLRGDRQPVYLAPELLLRLGRGRFDAVVVGGWNHLECYEALAWARTTGRRFVLWSETPLLGELPDRPLRNALKRLVISGADAFVVPGPSAARYLERLGASASSVHLAPNAVDSPFWAARPEHLEPPARPFVLYSGRLVETKGVDVALRAFATSRLVGSWDLVIAGDGPERPKLEAASGDGVRFVGSQDAESLRRLYHSASLLVFPSRYDPWGLVLNEAACAGLAAVASDAAGATRDMLVDGENGLVVPAGDVDALRAALDRVAHDPGLASRLGGAARKLVQVHSPQACAAGILAALR